MPPPYKRIYVIINPGSGKNEPILNVLNDVFRSHDVAWDIGVTHAFGDAERLAKEAAAADYDLIAGYGGDGTQHEIIKALLGVRDVVGMLPGGTGNGFSTGLGIPRDLRLATELLCTSSATRAVDVATLGDVTFMSRLYTGIEESEQTSRELKDKYGMLAYGINLVERSRNIQPVEYEISVDGQVAREVGTKVYVANSGSTGARIDVGDFDPTDGELDVFLISPDIATLVPAAARFFKVGATSGAHYWRGKQVEIVAKPDQPVWADGEYVCRTPIKVEVMHAAIRVVVPES